MRRKDKKMPYENTHACMLNSELKKVVGSQIRNHEGKRYTVHIAKKESGEGGSGERSYLYPASVWTAKEAAAHCKAHGGEFEPATGEAQQMNLSEPLENDFIPIEEGIIDDNINDK